MGAGKEKKATWQRQQPLSKVLPQTRFNLMAIGKRMSPSAIVSEEISYWSDHSGQLLGLVFRDKFDLWLSRRAMEGRTIAMFGSGYVNSDPNAVVGVRFSEELNADRGERWGDELQFFHNPNAKNPLPHQTLPGVTEHYFRDGVPLSFSYGEPVSGSRTVLLHLAATADLTA